LKGLYEIPVCNPNVVGCDFDTGLVSISCIGYEYGFSCRYEYQAVGTRESTTPPDIGQIGNECGICTALLGKGRNPAEPIRETGFWCRLSHDLEL